MYATLFAKLVIRAVRKAMWTRWRPKTVTDETVSQGRGKTPRRRHVLDNETKKGTRLETKTG